MDDQLQTGDGATSGNTTEAATERTAQQIVADARARRVAVVPGIIAALVGVPLILSAWAPTTFIGVWAFCYLIVSLFGLFGIGVLPAKTVDAVWNTGVGIAVCALPVSSAIWGDVPRDMFAFSIVTILHVSMNVNVQSHRNLAIWWLGIAVATPVTIIVVAIWGSVPLAIGLIMAVVGVLRAGLEAKKHNTIALEETRRAELLAEQDALTGLLNRRGITKAVVNLHAAGPLSVLMVDADRFKQINDTLGYATGDRVLVEIATALQDRLGDGWKVGRLGGDEFLAVAPERVAITDSVVDPVTFRLNHGWPTSRIHLSGGVMQSTASGDVDTIMRSVGYALHEAKRTKSRMVRFDQQMADELHHADAMAHALGDTITSESISAAAQTIVNDGRIVGCELLARLDSDDGLVLPGDFLPVVIKNGLMPDLNRAMIEQGVQFAARFNHLPSAPFVSVNVSSSALGSGEVIDHVRRQLAIHRVPPDRLMIEITESEDLQQFANWEAAATALRQLGVLLAIDDFGAGYSSIERMHLLPISHLKFDRSLTTQVSGSLGGLLRGITDFGRTVGFTVIAEGVESPDQAIALRALGVEIMQGFHFSKPAPLDDVERGILSQVVQQPQMNQGVGRTPSSNAAATRNL